MKYKITFLQQTVQFDFEGGFLSAAKVGLIRMGLKNLVTLRSDLPAMVINPDTTVVYPAEKGNTVYGILVEVMERP